MKILAIKGMLQRNHEGEEYPFELNEWNDDVRKKKVAKSFANYTENHKVPESAYNCERFGICMLMKSCRFNSLVPTIQSIPMSMKAVILSAFTLLLTSYAFKPVAKTGNRVPSLRMGFEKVACPRTPRLLRSFIASICCLSRKLEPSRLLDFGIR